jgi:tetratricopeptide (TPR) repeat protein
MAVVWACGPFFGIEALQDRKQTLLAPPTVSFERELRALVAKPKDQLPVVETEEKNWQTQEAAEFKPDVLERVNKMRGQTTGPAAYELGDGLAPAIRDYTAGAVCFRNGDKEGARAHFEAVVSMTDAGQRRSREVWAHFMLGRMAVQRADQEEATKQFQAVRAAVRGGMPDPLGLAVASYGEEARGAWQQGSVAQAVELYATQAAYGSDSGLNSLVTIAGLILKDYDLLDKGIQDDRTRRLLFICVNGNSSRAFFVGPDTGDGDDKTVPEVKDSNVDKIEAALERHQLKKVAGAGLLAAAAYHDGRFDLAEKLSGLEDVPISAWVKAKLALRSGNRTAALSAYQKALEGFAAVDGAGGTLREIRAETGVLRVSRGDYAQALELFYGATDDSESWTGFQDYWGDVAYLAERVLTIDELKDYVDHHLTGETPSKGESARGRLRSILARRLMREGRRGAALRYFDDADIRGAAQKYASALDAANRAWWPGFMKARAWMTAAQIARKSGLEILGYERQPDWAMWDGNFDAELGSKTPDPFQSGDERKRLNASKPALNERYQYRLTAVDEAKKAADLLPVKSQAYAAVLCEASEWVINRQPEMAQEMYVRYVRNGAYVPWAKTFGETCPAADFGVGSVYGVSKRVERLRKKAQRHLVPVALVAVGGTAVLSAVAYFVIGWRRRMA